MDPLKQGYRVWYHHTEGWQELPLHEGTDQELATLTWQVHWVSGWGFKWRISLPLLGGT
jgi:hypothetical protein